MDLPAEHRYGNATVTALDDACRFLDVALDVRVVTTDSIGDEAAFVSHLSAVVVGPGSPYREPEAVLAVIREARERQVPLVGT